jgi:hypothetical protein
LDTFVDLANGKPDNLIPYVGSEFVAVILKLAFIYTNLLLIN